MLQIQIMLFLSLFLCACTFLYHWIDLSVCLSLFLPFQPSLLFIAEIVASIGDCFFTVEKLCLKFAQKLFFLVLFSRCFVGVNCRVVVQWLCSAVRFHPQPKDAGSNPVISIFYSILLSVNCWKDHYKEKQACYSPLLNCFDTWCGGHPASFSSFSVVKKIQIQNSCTRKVRL